jgi:serine/threonine-protein kinase HipA
MSREIQVEMHQSGSEAQIMGRLRAVVSRGKEVFSFEYSDSWLARPPAIALDPDLRNFPGPQYLHDPARPNFGLFLDSSPDRWGRTLIRRREAMLAREENRPPRVLLESDYLLGVHDPQRLGALRFRHPPDGPFLSCNGARTAPPWTFLRKLEAATWKAQSDDGTDDPEAGSWLKLLIAPGSSLGGARPKAGVVDTKGALWIAKFPGNVDSVDVAGWEMLAHELGERCGLRLPEARLEKLARKHRTFLVRRFDRSPGEDGLHRHHFASAMALLARSDGTSAGTEDSYLDLAEFIQRHSPQAGADLAELWRRIVFSILIRNTDDHLRNHGFLWDERGWQLSPAFDINPNPDGLGLTLNITEDDNRLDPELARAVAPFFRVKDAEAVKQIAAQRRVVRTWRAVAKKLALPRSDMELMARAFSLVDSA